MKAGQMRKWCGKKETKPNQSSARWWNPILLSDAGNAVITRFDTFDLALPPFPHLEKLTTFWWETLGFSLRWSFFYKGFLHCALDG
ncbi:hypothetical protein T06_15653 [Trichinella sp. T6]|uniref:Uncharacterized protein n=1 Tax=Trichinella murrelli TaxID=144512 RepID=A0A0V0TDV9_9BILA|nr:hypothetical protein T05_14408 [Trichinella murrelli]KRX84061.1 hypothetical protein T06_15653 [Trichinella sp. T6]